MDARDLKLGADGDLDLAAGDLVLVGGGASIEQHIGIRLRFFRGEWFLDETAGLPYFDRVLVKNPNPAIVRALFRDELLATPGVAELVALELVHDRARRELAVSWRVTTDLGELAGSTGVQA